MMRKHLGVGATLACVGAAALAKLPPPSEEAKAKAAEAAARAAWAGKVDNYKLCLSMERVAAKYRTDLQKAGKQPPAATPTPACADPGPFVPPSQS